MRPGEYRDFRVFGSAHRSRPRCDLSWRMVAGCVALSAVMWGGAVWVADLALRAICR
jgi:hypothetical protein